MDAKDDSKGSQDEYPKRVTLGPKEVIVVTGGSGFLGQHIIRVLQERAEGVKEIRVVDVIPYKKKLEFEDNIPIEYYKADITIEDQLDSPFSGATCVIHTAAVVNVGHYVDRNQMRSVNMIGTTNVVFKCRQWNISKLVITSTVDAVFQKDSVFHNQSESQTELPCKEKNILMGYYGFTKAQAEAIVLCSKSLPLANGNRLKTAILRPTVCYGELDPYYVPAAMRVAKSCNGYLVKPKVFQGNPVLQSTYAGNAAWAHVLAVWKLTEEVKRKETGSNAESDEWTQVDGQTLYISDDTKPTTIYDFMTPFLALRGYSTVNSPVPVSFLLFFVSFTNWFVQNIFPISWKRMLNQYPVFPTSEGFRMAHSELHCSRKKSTKVLEYSPIYSESEAQERSAKYYRDLAI